MGRRIKLTAEEKKVLILECLAGRLRMREAARRAGVGHSTMHFWISRYRSEGRAALAEDGNQSKRSYSAEVRQKAVEEYLSGQGSSMAIAEKYKLRSGNLVLEWVKEYPCHRGQPNETGGMDMAKRTYTQEERLRAVVAHLERGQSIPEVAKAYGLPAQLVHSWVKKYRAQGFAGLEDRRGKRLSKQTPRDKEEALRIENARLQEENELLRLELYLRKKLETLGRGDV